MKRLFVFFMSLVLALGLLGFPAMASAANKDLTIEPVKEFRFDNPAATAKVFTITNVSAVDVEVTVEVFDQRSRQYVQKSIFTLLAGDAPYDFYAYVYKALERSSQVNAYSYKITTNTGFKAYHYYAQKLSIRKDDQGTLQHYYDQFTNTLYPRNTVSSFGPHFRDLSPSLTDKWYMVTPIDLSIQGRQSFVLVASNIYEVGQVFVDVSGDNVRVSYEMYNSERSHFSTETLSEFLTFFKAYSDITIVEPEDMKEPSVFAFNQPFSIQGHLDGDTNVLMFVRNRITYRRFPSPSTEYVRFWENLDHYKALRENMILMMDPLTAPETNK